MTSIQRQFTRRALMRRIKEERRQRGLKRKNKNKPIGPRPTQVLRQIWRQMQGHEEEE